MGLLFSMIGMVGSTLSRSSAIAESIVKQAKDSRDSSKDSKKS